MWDWFSSVFAAFRDLWFLIGAVTKGAAFPTPLSREEERQFLERLGRGDGQARIALIERNMRLVAYIAKKYVTPTRTLEDLVSIGTIGLIKAVDSYKPERAKNLAGYLARCIENEILMSIRAEKKTRREISLQGSVGVDKEGKELPLEDVLDSQEEPLPDQVAKSLMQTEVRRAVFSRLEPRERQVVIERYGLSGGEPQTQRQVAQRLGISRSYVSRIEKKALSRLREAMEAHEKLD